MFPDALKPVDPLPAELHEPPTPIVQKGHQQHGGHADSFGSPGGGRMSNSSSSASLATISGSGLTLGASFRKVQGSPPTKNSSSPSLNMLAENSGSENGSVSGKSVTGEGSMHSMAESIRKKKRKVQIDGQGLDDLDIGVGFVLDEEDTSLADSAGRLTHMPRHVPQHATL